MAVRERSVGYRVPSEADPRLWKIPALSSFRERVDAVLTGGGPAAFAQCGPIFAELVGSSFLTDLVNYELGLLSENPNHVGEGMRNSSAFDVALTPEWTLSVRLSAGDVSVTHAAWSSAEHFMLGVAPAAGAPDLEYELFEQRTVEPVEVFDPNRTLSSKGSFAISPGHVKCFRAGADVLRFPKLARRAVVVAFTSATVLPFRWGYDLRTLRPTGLATSYGPSWRLEYAIRLLVAAHHVEAVPTLRSLAGHDDHFIRWTAVRAVAALAPDLTTAMLRAATSDPHPEIRRVARRALATVPDTNANGTPNPEEEP